MWMNWSSCPLRPSTPIAPYAEPTSSTAASMIWRSASGRSRCSTASLLASSRRRSCGWVEALVPFASGSVIGASGTGMVRVTAGRRSDVAELHRCPSRRGARYLEAVGVRDSFRVLATCQCAAAPGGVRISPSVDQVVEIWVPAEPATTSAASRSAPDGRAAAVSATKSQAAVTFGPIDPSGNTAARRLSRADVADR